MNLISRRLLTPDEVLSIENPYAIVMMAGKPPAITNLPDISKTHFNQLNGMGTKEENQVLRIQREELRETRPIQEIKIWDIWNKKTHEEGKQLELIQNKFKERVNNHEKNI